MTTFHPFFNPATGEWTEYTTVAEDSNVELVRSDSEGRTP
jgi:hypothetical protein